MGCACSAAAGGDPSASADISPPSSGNVPAALQGIGPANECPSPPVPSKDKGDVNGGSLSSGDDDDDAHSRRDSEGCVCDEPSPLRLAARRKVAVVAARVFHGIDDDVDQFRRAASPSRGARRRSRNAADLRDPATAQAMGGRSSLHPFRHHGGRDDTAVAAVAPSAVRYWLESTDSPEADAMPASGEVVSHDEGSPSSSAPVRTMERAGAPRLTASRLLLHNAYSYDGFIAPQP